MKPPVGSDAKDRRRFKPPCSTRRALLRGAGAAGLAWLLRGLHPHRTDAAPPGPANPAEIFRGRVALVRDPELAAGRDRLSMESLRRRITRCLEAITGERGTDAWRVLFKPQDRVAIKVNALGGPMIGTSPRLAQAIASGLVETGLKPGQILIWDRSSSELSRAGYAVSTQGAGPYCFGTDRYGYERVPRMAGSIGSCFSPILTRWATALVDVPVLKDHDLSGVSLSIKNLFGMIHNPNKYHDSGCTPYLVDLLAFREVQIRWRLAICDAIRAQCHRGPAYAPRWAWPYGGLLVSADPVALDATGAGILEDRRRQLGLPSLSEEKRSPIHIRLAHERGLGEARREAIRLLELD